MAQHEMRPRPMRAAGVASFQNICTRCNLEVWVNVPSKQIAGLRYFWNVIPSPEELPDILDSIPCAPHWRPSGPSWRTDMPA
jgi:hypothetical protein